jgi:hypothetical protein
MDAKTWLGRASAAQPALPPGLNLTQRGRLWSPDAPANGPWRVDRPGLGQVRRGQNVEKLIAQFDKNASEEVRVQLREFRGHQLLDVRVYFRPDNGGEARPTKKGISVSVGLISKIQDAISKATEALEAEGIATTRPEPDKPSTAPESEASGEKDEPASKAPGE